MNPDSAVRGALVALGFVPGLGGAERVARVIPRVMSMTESCQRRERIRISNGVFSSWILTAHHLQSAIPLSSNLPAHEHGHTKSCPKGASAPVRYPTLRGMLTSRSKDNMYRHRNLQTECPIVHERHGEKQGNLDDPSSKRNHTRLESWEPVTPALLGFALEWGKGELRR